jgi:hypothetical protein
LPGNADDTLRKHRLESPCHQGRVKQRRLWSSLKPGLTKLSGLLIFGVVVMVLAARLFHLSTRKFSGLVNPRQAQAKACGYIWGTKT